MNKIKIAILLAIHNKITYTKKYLPELTSLALQNFKVTHFEIIIIDDGSNDGSKEWIINNYEEIHLINGNGNLWWTGAINLGAKYAIEVLNVDFVLLWNNDIFPEKTYFTTLDSLFQKKFPNEIIGSKIIIKDSDEVWSLGGFLNKFTGSYNMIRENKRDNFKINWQPGMGTLIPASIIIKNNYWDNMNFPQYHGDSDFCLRAWANGTKISTNTDLILYNDKSNTGFQIKTIKDYFKSLNGIKSNLDICKMLKFYRRHTIGPLPYIRLIKVYLHILIATIYKQLFKK